MKRLSLLLAASLAIPSFASAQMTVDLTFSGGSGTPFTVNIDTPITLQTTNSAGSGLWIVFENVGIFADSSASTGYLTTNDPKYVDVGGSLEPISYVGNNYGPASPQPGVVTDDDLWLSVTDTTSSGLGVVASGTTVTLSTGSVTTNGSYSFGPPTGGTFNVILTDYNGNSLGAVAVPEPSTYAAAAGGLALLAAFYRRRKKAQAE